MTKKLNFQICEFLRLLQMPLPLNPPQDSVDYLISGLTEVLINENDEEIIIKAIDYLDLIAAGSRPSLIPALVGVIVKDPRKRTAEEIKWKLSADNSWTCGRATEKSQLLLKKLFSDISIDHLKQYCNHDDPKVRYRLLRTLMVIKEPAKEIIQLLIQFLTDTEYQIRREVLLAFWDYPSLSSDVLDSISASILDRDEIVCRSDSDESVSSRADYLLANRISGYQRRCSDAALNVFSRIISPMGSREQIDAIMTIRMMGSDAIMLADLIVGLLKVKNTLDDSMLAMLSCALHEIICYNSDLKEKLCDSLRILAMSSNGAAKFLGNAIQQPPLIDLRKLA